MRQINFHMMEKDEREFEQFLLSRTDTLIFPTRWFKTRRPKHVSCLPPVSEAKKIEFVNSVLMPHPVCSAKGAGGTYSFDMFKDPHIGFNRSYLVDDLLIPGRLYAKIGWLEPTEDNRVFSSRYATLERWLKKRYTKNHRGWWIAPAAKRRSLDGGRLAYGENLPGVLIESLKDAQQVKT
jgi:hypothetical protein